MAEEMHDMTGLWEIFRKSRNLTREQMSVPYYMYFDETGNWKTVKEKDANNQKTLNLPNIQEHFVLGGIATKELEKAFSFEELQNLLRIYSPGLSEMKAENVIRGDFLAALKSKSLHSLLNYIKEHKWFIHFSVSNLLYYSIVDIIDSIFYNSSYQQRFINDEDLFYGVKDEFYRIFICNLEHNIDELLQFDYPDVQKEKLSSFRTFVAAMIIKYYENGGAINTYTKTICQALEESEKSNHDLIFNEEGKKGVLIDDFSHFYTTRISVLAYSQLTLDNEADIEAYLRKTPLCVEGNQLVNYKFERSNLNTYIQISDIIVSLIKKYFNFLDRSWAEVQKDTDSLKYLDKNNLYLLNDILLYSEKESKLFIDIVDRAEVIYNFKNVRDNYNNQSQK